MPDRKSYQKFATKSLLISVLINSSFIIANYLAIAANGSNVPLTLVAFLQLPVLLCILLLPVYLLMLLSQRFRLKAMRGLIGSALFIVTAVACLRPGDEARDWGFEQLADRSMVLVQAIEQYETQAGHLPLSEYDRLSVAYGLAQGTQWQYRWPDQIEDLPTHRRHAAEFVSKDVV